MLEPSHAGEDEENSSEVGSCPGEEDATAGAEEPEGAGNHDENAEPGDLARGTDQSVGDDREAEPENRGAVGGRLESPKTGVEAEDNGEEAKDVAHVGDGEHEVKG